MEKYSFDQVHKVWIRPGTASISYNDGDESENYLAHVLENAKDVSSTSPELVPAIKDWPSEYHLSATRHNLLRFCNVKKRQRILELGAGCGAITRYLGEIGAKVVSVEGSLRRASIAAERCRDLANVQIVCDNIAHLDLEERFDVVTLIGVLEYSQVFIDAEDPVLKCLQIARSFLNENGILILAIENQLGLKYFNGCKEDHLGIPYFGIHGLYEEKTPITFGKKKLKEKLKHAGFDGIHFSYPFPDYKHPSVILANEALNHQSFKYADLLHRVRHQGEEQGFPHFNENLAWQAIADNQLLPHLANSFLVIAAESEDKLGTLPWIACVYSLGRKHEYNTETLFKLGENRRITVCKRPQFHSHSSSDAELFVKHEPTIEAAYMEAQAEIDKNGVLSLPGDMLDAIPTNIVMCEPGSKFAYIDDEWSIHEAVPFFWVAVRGLVIALASSAPSSKINDRSVRDLISSILAANRYSISHQDFATAVTLENKLQQQVSIESQDFALVLESTVSILCKTYTNNEEAMRRELVHADNEIKRMKHAVSWKVTKPLRLIANLPKHIKKISASFRNAE